MNRKNKKYKILLLSFLGIAFVFFLCFFIYDSCQIKDPKYYFDLGIKASYPRDIPVEIKNFKKAVYYCHKDISKHSSLAISSYRGLATAYMHKEAYDKAEETLLKGLEVSMEYFGSDSKETASLYDRLSLYASYDKQFDKSAQYYCKVLEIQEKLYPKDSKNLALTCHNISILYKKAKNEPKFIEYSKKTQQYFGEKIVKLSKNEKEFIKLNSKRINGFLKKYSNFNKSDWDLIDLDTALKYWLLSDVSNKMSNETVKNIVGSALGDYLEKKYNMFWCRIHDQYGTALVCRENKELTTAPFSYLAKGIEKKEYGFLRNLELRIQDRLKKRNHNQEKSRD